MKGTEASQRRVSRPIIAVRLPGAGAEFRRDFQRQEDEMHTTLRQHHRGQHEKSSTVFIGGDFKYLESSRGEVVNQSNIAGSIRRPASCAVTSTPDAQRPGQAVEALPNNRLAIGGYFTTVNGRPFSVSWSWTPPPARLPPEWETRHLQPH